jgi:DNA replication licensing factor MCM7
VQRRFNFQQRQQTQEFNIGGGAPQTYNHIPPELDRNYQVFIVNNPDAKLDKDKFKKMRDMKSVSIGSLVTVKGIVTRASDVRPCVQVATYNCDVCGFETY